LNKVPKINTYQPQHSMQCVAFIREKVGVNLLNFISFAFTLK
jgi:hypothetical protein